MRRNEIGCAGVQTEGKAQRTQTAQLSSNAPIGTGGFCVFKARAPATFSSGRRELGWISHLGSMVLGALGGLWSGVVHLCFSNKICLNGLTGDSVQHSRLKSCRPICRFCLCSLFSTAGESATGMVKTLPTWASASLPSGACGLEPSYPNTSAIPRTASSSRCRRLLTKKFANFGEFQFIG